MTVQEIKQCLEVIKKQADNSHMPEVIYRVGVVTILAALEEQIQEEVR